VLATPVTRASCSLPVVVVNAPEYGQGGRLPVRLTGWAQPAARFFAVATIFLSRMSSSVRSGIGQQVPDF
jgi:hypothetical protein